jgi:trehalose 6-phosphate synthase
LDYRGHKTKITSLPASVDYKEIESCVINNGHNLGDYLKEDLGIDNLPSKYLSISVDRIDYTKGIVERLRTVEKLLELHPEYRGALSHIFVGVPSRLKIHEYNTYHRSVVRLINAINKKFQTDKWKPVYFINRAVERKRLFSYFAHADLCMVTSLDDGMNLVAKEFAIACNPKKGSLILSKFTGAAKDLTDAILVNPYDIIGTAGALHEALKMPSKEKFLRNMNMKAMLREKNIFQWGIDFLKNVIT